MFTFGYSPALAEAGDIAWGARGIDDGKSIGFLGDRQTWYLRGKPIDQDASEEDKAALMAFHRLMMRSVFDEIQEAFREAKNNWKMESSGSEAVVFLEDWFIKVTAKASGGYVYVTVATKPLPDVPVLRELKDEHKNQDAATYKSPTDYLVWSCDSRPELGERVFLDASRGAGTVVGWNAELGYLFMMVVLDGGDLTNAMGREWSHIKEVEDVA